jgi:hypothetical protein
MWRGYLPVLGVAASLPAHPSRLHRDEPQRDVSGLHRLPDHSHQGYLAMISRFRRAPHPL